MLSSAQVVTGEQHQSMKKRDRVIPRFISGNIIVVINKNEYSSGLSEFENN